jgi:hypothetical protein
MDASKKTKDRKTAELRGVPTVELAWVTEAKQRKRGCLQESKALRKEIFPDIPGPSTKHQVFPYSPEEAMALFCDVNLSQESYQTLRNGAVLRNWKSLYPTYKVTQRVRKECQPSTKNLSLTGDVDEQDILDHIAWDSGP